MGHLKSQIASLQDLIPHLHLGVGVRLAALACINDQRAQVNIVNVAAVQDDGLSSLRSADHSRLLVTGHRKCGGPIGERGPKWYIRNVSESAHAEILAIRHAN
jgi:hypothetical protein